MTTPVKGIGEGEQISLPSLKHALSVSWREFSACAKIPKDVFFEYRVNSHKDRVLSTPTSNLKVVDDSVDVRQTRAHNGHLALKTCGTCPVRSDCYEFAVKNNERFGIWAGTTPETRDRLYKEFCATGTLVSLPKA